MNADGNIFASVQTVTQVPEDLLPCFSTLDAAREIGKSTTRVKEVARELDLLRIHTGTGRWLLSRRDINRLRDEFARRAAEDARR